MENHADFERDLLDMALRHSLFPGRDPQFMTDDRHVVSRRLVNLLSTAKLYVDQLQHDLSRAYGHGSALLTEGRQLLSREYHTSLGYRVIEAVRNHTQHRDLPVQRIHYPMRLIEGSPPMWRCSVGASLDIRTLQDDPKFKRSVLEDLRPLASDEQSVEVAPLVREYVQSIGRVQMRVRELIAPDLGAADALIVDARDRARLAAQGTSLAGLSIVRRDEDGRSHGWEWVSTELIDRRKELQKKNSHLDSLTRRYVSSIDEP